MAYAEDGDGENERPLLDEEIQRRNRAKQHYLFAPTAMFREYGAESARSPMPQATDKKPDVPKTFSPERRELRQAPAAQSETTTRARPTTTASASTSSRDASQVRTHQSNSSALHFLGNLLSPENRRLDISMDTKTQHTNRQQSSKNRTRR